MQLSTEQLRRSQEESQDEPSHTFADHNRKRARRRQQTKATALEDAVCFDKELDAHAAILSLSAALPRPYVVRSSDLKDGTLLLMPGNCGVNWEEGHNAPEELQRHMSSQVCAVKANGDGACAMHSIFGKPAVWSELFPRDARAAAIDELRTLPGLAEENATANTFLEHLLTNLWVDFAMPCIEGRPSEEGDAF